jgi:diguanylate cyclase (GGDEF)-like protein
LIAPARAWRAHAPLQVRRKTADTCGTAPARAHARAWPAHTSTHQQGTAHTVKANTILRPLRDPGFSRKLTIAFLVVILVVAMTIPVAFYAFYTIHESLVREDQAAQTLENVSTLQNAIDNMRVSARDYADTGRSIDRNDLDNFLNVLTDDIHCIKDATGCRTGDSYVGMPAAERARWSALIDEASAAHSAFVAQIQAGQTQAGVEQFDKRIKANVEAPANQLAANVRIRGRTARSQIDVLIVSSGALLLLVLAVALLVASLLAYIIPRPLMRRLDDLRRTAHLIASGDLTARTDEKAIGTDEISVLIRDFNSMARSLQQREDELRLLQLQLQQALMNEQERSTRDPLTGLRNHRYFQDSLHAEIDRCGRTSKPVTIAVIDLDNFKSVNDRFGHHEGDAVLLRITKGISDNLRPYDLACRLGGEEFGVIFPETHPDEAKAVLERIQAHVLGFGPGGERATFSAGVATYPVHSKVQSDLYQLADEAAYHSKNNGKNQVTIYDARTVQAMDSEERLAQRSREAVLTTATTLVAAVDRKDPYTRSHSELTAIYAATLARALSMPEDDVKVVYRAALLHDVGKIGIADGILKKPDLLTPEEWASVQMHPEFSYRILESAEMEPIATWTRHHHEHWDGSGYPLGLSGEDIPFGSRIILVADAFEAMTSDRVYRRSLGIEQAVAELQANAGTQFDPAIADLMVRLVMGGVFDQVHAQYGKPAALVEAHAVMEPPPDQPPPVPQAPAMPAQPPAMPPQPPATPPQSPAMPPPPAHPPVPPCEQPPQAA